MNANDDALLNDLLDGRLDDDAARVLETRLATDAELAAAWEDLQRIRTLLRESDLPRAPEDFLEGVRHRVARIDEELDDEAAIRLLAPPPRRDHGPRLRLIALPLAAAAVLLIGLVVADRLGEGDRRATPISRTVESAYQPESKRELAGELAGELDGLEAGGEALRRRGSAPRFRPGDAVPSGLRTPSDDVRPDALAPSAASGDAAIAAATPILVYALSTESAEIGTASLAALFDGRLQAGRGGLWHVIEPERAVAKSVAVPMAASPPLPPTALLRLEATHLDPTRVEVEGRKVFDSVTMLLSEEQARRLGAASKTPAPAGSTRDEEEADKKSAKRVRVRIWFVR